MESYLLLSFVIVFFVLLAWGAGRHLLFLFMIWFSHFWMALSSGYLEGGVYITEQQRNSFPNNATVMLLALEACFWFCTLLVIKVLHRIFPLERTVRYSPLGNWLICLFSGAALAMLLVNVALTGSPLFDASLTRFNFWDNAKLPLLNQILGSVASPFVVMVGVVYALSLDSGRGLLAKIALLIFIGFLAYYVLMGQKFSMQLLAFSLFMPSVLFLRWQKFGKLNIKLFHVVVMAFIGFLMLGLISWYYLQKHVDFVDGQGGVLNAVLYRIFGLQGHVWWGSVTEYQHGNVVVDPLGAMLNGMSTSMYTVSPMELVDRYLDAGVRFTMAYPGIAVLSFGALGAALFQLVAGGIVGCFVFFCERQLAERRLLGSILALIVLSNFWVVFNMGEFITLMSFKFIVPLMALIFLFFLSAATRRVGS